MRRRALALVPGMLLLVASPARSAADGPSKEREICAPARVLLADGTTIRADRLVAVGDSLRTFIDIEMRLSPPGRFSSPEFPAFTPAPVPVRRTIPLSRVDAVECPDPLSDGAIAGFFIGGISLAIVSAIAVAGSVEHASGPAILGAVGMGMGIGGVAGGVTGAFIDAAFVRRLRPADLLEEGSGGDGPPTGRVEHTPSD